MSYLAQSVAWPFDTLAAMSEQITILHIEQDGGEGLIVTFSDGTIAGYVVEELLDLRPARLHAPKPKDPPKTTTTQS